MDEQQTRRRRQERPQEPQAQQPPAGQPSSQDRPAVQPSPDTSRKAPAAQGERRPPAAGRDGAARKGGQRPPASAAGSRAAGAKRPAQHPPRKKKAEPIFLDETDSAFSDEFITRRKVTETPQEKPKGLFGRIDAVVCLIGDWCLAAIKAVLLSLVMLFAYGVQGIRNLLSRPAGAGKKPEDKKPAEGDGEDVLNALLSSMPVQAHTAADGAPTAAAQEAEQTADSAPTAAAQEAEHIAYSAPAVYAEENGRNGEPPKSDPVLPGMPHGAEEAADEPQQQEEPSSLPRRRKAPAPLDERAAAEPAARRVRREPAMRTADNAPDSALPAKTDAPQTSAARRTRPAQAASAPTVQHRAQREAALPAQKKKPKGGAAPKKNGDMTYRLAMAGLVCVMVVSLFMIGSIVTRTIRTNSLNDSLSEQYHAMSAQGTAAPQQADDATPTPTLRPTPVPTPRPTMGPLVVSGAAHAAGSPTPRPIVQSTKYHQIGGEPLPAMESLYQRNRDLVGWLHMESILDLPVVYRDNSYYLTRDFDKKKNAAGTLFLDVNHPMRENTQNLLLHGHNMRDGTMFGRLVQYETNLQYLKNNPFVKYSTLWREEQYVIFAVLHVSLDVKDENFFNYFTHPTFTSDTQFDSYIRALQNRSVWAIPIDVEPSDALLTLSTCLEDDRLVIVARRVREGESRSELRSLVHLASRQ